MSVSMTDRYLDVIVDRTEKVAEDVLAIDFVAVSGDELPEWEPGAHIDLHLPSGLIRSYSLCGDPHDRSRYRVAVLHVRDGRGGSREVHEIDWKSAIDPHSPRIHRVSLPRNNFALVDANEYLFVAGGIGITPLLPMMARVASQGRTWRLIYGGRSLDSMAFRTEIERLTGGDIEFVPQDTAGLIDIATNFGALSSVCETYICGPPGLLDVAQSIARDLGTEARLHLERFSASESTVPEGSNTAFDVELRRSDKVLHVAADESILAKVLEFKPSHPWSCEDGICGSCETTVLDGEVDHRDDILTPAEQAANDTMFICVSRCKGQRLVLDL